MESSVEEEASLKIASYREAPPGGRTPLGDREGAVQAGKGRTGLDPPLDLLVPLDRAGDAFLASTTARTANDALTHAAADAIQLTCGKIRCLLTTTIIRPISSLAHALVWSLWRRQAQPRARVSHYHRQAALTQ